MGITVTLRLGSNIHMNLWVITPAPETKHSCQEWVGEGLGLGLGS